MLAFASGIHTEADGTEYKVVDGKIMYPVAIQSSLRTRRKKRDIHLYHLRGTRDVYYNHSRDYTVFFRIAMFRSNMERYYQTFVQPPVTHEEQLWLDRYGYMLLA